MANTRRQRRNGRLHPIHRGVYAVGHRGLTREGAWMAAALVAAGAVLSHRSATALWGIWSTGQARIEVTASPNLRRRPRLRIHRAALTRDEVTVHRHHIPRPQMNATVDDKEADCLWPEQRLIAELDGFATHGTREAFERDRARDRALQAAGDRVIRITWRQLVADPPALAGQLRTLLRP